MQEPTLQPILSVLPIIRRFQSERTMHCVQEYWLQVNSGLGLPRQPKTLKFLVRRELPLHASRTLQLQELVPMWLWIFSEGQMPIPIGGFTTSALIYLLETVAMIWLR